MSEIKTKRFAPIRIKNPTSLEHLVRVEPGQNIHLLCTQPQFDVATVQISGRFLQLEQIEPVAGGWSAVITQTGEPWVTNDTVLVLGRIDVCGPELLASMQVVQGLATANYLQIIQPETGSLRLEPHQSLEVLLPKDWVCSIVRGGRLCLQQMSHQYRAELICFRFRLTPVSRCFLHDWPPGKYEAGSLLFVKIGEIIEQIQIRVVLQWRQTIKKPPEHLISQANTSLRKLNYEQLDTGCRVTFAVEPLE